MIVNVARNEMYGKHAAQSNDYGDAWEALTASLLSRQSGGIQFPWTKRINLPLSLLAWKFHNINSIRMSGNADILFKETVSLWRHGGSSRRRFAKRIPPSTTHVCARVKREKESDTKCFRIFSFQISFVTKRKICERFRETCEEYLCLGKFIRQFLFPKPRRNNLILKIFWY